MKKIVNYIAVTILFGNVQAQTLSEDPCKQVNISSLDRDKEVNNSFRAIAYDMCKANDLIQCSMTGKALSTVYEALLDEWASDKYRSLPTFVSKQKIIDNEIDKNIYRNFSELKINHQNFLGDVEKLAKNSGKEASSVKSAANLREFRETLKETHKALAQKNQDLIKKETKFLIAIDLLKVNIVSSMFKFQEFFISYDCSPLKSDIEKYVDHSRKWYAEISDIQRFLAISSFKRRIIADIYIKSLERKALQSYALYVGEDVENVLSTIGNSLKTDDLLWKIDDWWLEANGNGLANRLHTTYLVYREPLHILKGLKGDLISLKESVSALNVGDSVKSEINSRLNNYDENIDRNIQYIENRGWKGFLESQVQMVQRRLDFGRNLSEKCTALLNKHQEKSGSSNNINYSTYEKLEAIYVQIVRECR